MQFTLKFSSNVRNWKYNSILQFQKVLTSTMENEYMHSHTYCMYFYIADAKAFRSSKYVNIFFNCGYYHLLSMRLCSDLGATRVKSHLFFYGNADSMVCVAHNYN